MAELIGSFHNLDPGTKFNLQLFPGLKVGGGRGPVQVWAAINQPGPACPASIMSEHTYSGF